MSCKKSWIQGCSLDATVGLFVASSVFFSLFAGSFDVLQEVLDSGVLARSSGHQL